MNRKTKGALAAGAGAILLLGGAGSYALWGAEENLAGGNITTGNFGLDCGTNGVWTDISGDVPVVTFDPATNLMVPGDIWEYTSDCTVTATGKNMKAELQVTGVGSSTTADNIDIVTKVGTTTDAPVVVSNGQVIPVSVTVTFDSATEGIEDINTTVNVNGMKISLDQVRP